jgi:glycosyltransferase involved in cell wall biosynthesis
MRRVLIFHPALAPYRVDLFNELALRCRLKIIFIRDNLLNQKFDQSELRSRLFVDHEYLTTGFTVGARSFRFGVGERIRAFKPDIVISHELSPVTLAVNLRKRVSASSFRHVVWSADNSQMVKGDGVLRSTVRQWLLTRVDGLLLYTNEVADLYRLKFNYNRPIGVVPNVTDGGRFRELLSNSGADAAKAIQRHGLNDKRVVLYVGRLSREKRVDRIIQAFAAGELRSDNFVFVVVGDGGERAALEQLVAELDVGRHVVFAGRHEGAALAAWYRIAGAFVLASEFEPFGAVVNEALLAGIPVICSEMAGARVLIQEGKNGSVIDAADNVALCSHLLKWLRCSPALTTEPLSALRPSLMAVKFEDVVDSYVDLLRVVSEAGANNRAAA